MRKLLVLAAVVILVTSAAVAQESLEAKKAGGMDRAMSIWAEYEDHVAHVERVIAGGGTRCRRRSKGTGATGSLRARLTRGPTTATVQP